MTDDGLTRKDLLEELAKFFTENSKPDDDTEAIGGIGAEALQYNTWHTHCPFCDRKEKVKSQHAATAWLTLHIEEEHSDELPEVAGVKHD